jgi:CheY-like chemotaxis protein
MLKFQNVLLVDDNAVANSTNEKLIINAGLTSEVKVTLNGGHAICYLNQKFSDIPVGENKLLILLDLEMPIMDGFEFLEFYNKCNFLNKENICIAVMTDAYNDADISRAKRLGAFDWIPKPLTIENLRGLVGDMGLEPVTVGSNMQAAQSTSSKARRRRHRNM